MLDSKGFLKEKIAHQHRKDIADGQGRASHTQVNPRQHQDKQNGA